MSELSNAFGNFQSSFQGAVGSDDGSTQQHIASELANFAQGYSKNAILDKRQEDAERKAQLDAQKDKLAEDDLANKAESKRLFALKGGSKLPKYDPNFSPQEKRSEPENLEYANIGLRKNYQILFATSKIAEEQAYVDTNAEELAAKWEQEFLDLDDTDTLKTSYTKFAAFKAIEFKKERNTFLSGLPEAETALNKTPIKYGAIETAIAKHQQTYINRQSGKFLSNYASVEYQGKSGSYPLFESKPLGPPQTSKDALELVGKLRGTVNKGNGKETLYSNSQVWDAVFGNWRQHLGLATSSTDPIFKSLDLYDPQSGGLELTGLGEGIGEEHQKYHKEVYTKYVNLVEKEEKEAGDSENKKDTDLDKLAYLNIANIDDLLENATLNPGAVTEEDIRSLEITLDEFSSQGAFASKSEHSVYRESNRKLTIIRNMIDKNNTAYVPNTQEKTDLQNFENKLLDDVKTLKALEIIARDVARNEKNPWLKVNKLLSTKNYNTEFLKEFALDTSKATNLDKNTSNSLMSASLEKLELAHSQCLKEGKCETFNTLAANSTLEAKLLNPDFKVYSTDVRRMKREQSASKVNTLELNNVKKFEAILNNLKNDPKYTIAKAEKDFKALNFKISADQYTSYSNAVRDFYNVQQDLEKKLKASTSFTERSTTLTEILNTKDLDSLETIYDGIKSTKVFIDGDKRFLEDKIVDQRKVIENKSLTEQDKQWSKSVRKELNKLLEQGTKTTPQDLQTFQTNFIDNKKWFGDDGKIFRNLISTQISKQASSGEIQQRLKEISEYEEDTSEAESSLKESLNDIVKNVIDTGYSVADGKRDIQNILTNYAETNKSLLATGKKLNQKLTWTSLGDTAIQLVNQKDSENVERAKKKKEEETKAAQIKEDKRIASTNTSQMQKLLIPAVHIKTAALLEQYEKDNVGKVNIHDKAKFTNDIQRLMERILSKKGNTDIAKRLQEDFKTSYYERYISETDLTVLAALRKEAGEELGLGTDRPGVERSIIERIDKVKKLNVETTSLNVFQKIKDDLHKGIITEKTFKAAEERVKQLKDIGVRKSAMSFMNTIGLRKEGRNFNADEIKKKLAKDFKKNRFLAGIETSLLEIVNPAETANINFTGPKSDIAVKAALKKLEKLRTSFKKNKSFIASMDESGETEWITKFSEAESKLLSLESKISKQQTVAINLQLHAESKISREQDRSVIETASANLATSYTDEAHKSFLELLDAPPTPLVDATTGKPLKDLLYTSSQFQKIKDDANVAKELSSSTPKETDQAVFNTLYTDYFDKIAVEADIPTKRNLIALGKKYLKTQFINLKVSKPSFNSYSETFNDYLNKDKIKKDNGKQRGAGTIDSVFRSQNTERSLGGQLLLAADGDWRAIQDLHESMRAYYFDAWNNNIDKFQDDPAQSYKFATDLAKQLISEDEKINPLPKDKVLILQKWYAGLMGRSKKKPVIKGATPPGGQNADLKAMTTDEILGG